MGILELPSQFIIRGEELQSLLEPKDLALEIGGEACDPGTGPCDVLFLVDVSDSVSDKQLEATKQQGSFENKVHQTPLKAPGSIIGRNFRMPNQGA